MIDNWKDYVTDALYDVTYQINVYHHTPDSIALFIEYAHTTGANLSEIRHLAAYIAKTYDLTVDVQVEQDGIDMVFERI